MYICELQSPTEGSLTIIFLSVHGYVSALAAILQGVFAAGIVQVKKQHLIMSHDIYMAYERKALYSIKEETKCLAVKIC